MAQLNDMAREAAVAAQYYCCLVLQDVLQAWGSVLKHKVAAISTSRREGCLAPSDACRGYALYAASSLLNRSG